MQERIIPAPSHGQYTVFVPKERSKYNPFPNLVFFDVVIGML